MSDTSPLRALHHLQLLTVLRELFGTVVLPPAVVSELDAQKRFAAIDLKEIPFVRVQAPLDRKAVTELQLKLDAGEAEAIALAEELHADWLLVDERAACEMATERGVQTTGVLGVLVRAKARRLIPEVMPLALKLRNELGFHLSDAILVQVRNLAGE